VAVAVYLRLGVGLIN